MVIGGGWLNLAGRWVARGDQSHRFKFFARHFLFPLHHVKSFIVHRAHAAARREIFPAWPSARRGRDAAASESCQSGIRPFARLPRNSFLPPTKHYSFAQLPWEFPPRPSHLLPAVTVLPPNRHPKSTPLNSTHP